MTIRILSLHTYPVKSCGAITHTQVDVWSAGLAHDRQWVVVDAEGRFLTQRAHPGMALVQPALGEGALSLNAPEMPTLRVSLRNTGSASPPTPISIWRNDTLGQDEGDVAAHWFSDYLGLACRLYRVHPDAQRLADPQRVAAWLERHAVTDAGTVPQHHAFGFADSFPFLIANQSSLDDLNQHLAARDLPAVGMNRFRPNIVIQGLAAYEEDYVSHLRIGPMTFAMVRGCPRCPMPNVDPATAETGPEPMATLSRYRQFETGILFGMHAVVGGAGRNTVLSVGDHVEALLDI